MTNSDLIKKVIENTVSDLTDSKIFTDARVSSTQTTNVQNQQIVNLLRTNQFLLGELILDLTSIKSEFIKLKIEINDNSESIQTIRDHLKNSQTDELLSKQFNDQFKISDEIKALNKAIENAKVLNKEVLQPDFGWTRRGSGNWL